MSHQGPPRSEHEETKVEIGSPPKPPPGLLDDDEEVRGTSGADHWRRVEKAMKEPTNWAPRPKVAAGGAAGNVVVILLWIAGVSGLEVPAEVAGAFAALLCLGVAYLVPETEAKGEKQ